MQKRLPELTVVRETHNGDKVFFGATVDVCDDVGETRSYRIVGPDETDAKTAAISIDSPLAKALLGKQVDDEVTISVGDTTATVTVESIRYEA